MMQIKIYIGLTTKDGQVIDSNKAIQDILEIVPFEGYTMYQAKGVYKEQLEDTIIIEFYTDKFADSLFTVAKKLKNHFNQECVMLTLGGHAHFI